MANNKNCKRARYISVITCKSTWRYLYNICIYDIVEPRYLPSLVAKGLILTTHRDRNLSLSLSLVDRYRGNNRNYRFSFAFIEARSEGRKSNRGAKTFPRIQSSGSNCSQKTCAKGSQERNREIRDTTRFVSIAIERVPLIDIRFVEYDPPPSPCR